MLKRRAEVALASWRDKASRKPLLVQGVRQCGKTHLLRTYAASEFAGVAYVNLENDRAARADFQGNLDPRQIVRAIEARTGQRVIPGETLIVIDEIQTCEEAVTSLKYFCEEAPEYHVAAAGSLLGVAINRFSHSFPVGKVEPLTMRPLDFGEYLWARGANALGDAISEAFELRRPPSPPACTRRRFPSTGNTSSWEGCPKRWQHSSARAR